MADGSRDIRGEKNADQRAAARGEQIDYCAWQDHRLFSAGVAP